MRTWSSSRGGCFLSIICQKKPVKYGIKVWMAADSKTGYFSTYDIYLGKPLTSARGEVGLATNVVLNLTEPFQHCNRHIYFDNFFTSVKLVEELLHQGTYACDKLRANRYPNTYKANKRMNAEDLNQVRRDATVTERYNTCYLVV